MLLEPSSPIIATVIAALRTDLSTVSALINHRTATLRTARAFAWKARPTINNIESERFAGEPETLAAIRKALEGAGVEFTNGKRPGVSPSVH